jgi:hypothetical protein
MLAEATNNNFDTVAPTYSFKETLVASQKINRRIEDIIGGDKRLDFTKPSPVFC